MPLVQEIIEQDETEEDLDEDIQVRSEYFEPSS